MATLWDLLLKVNIGGRQQRQPTIAATFGLQHADGGWSTTSLGSYTRVDNTPNDTGTAGYATALAPLALEEAWRGCAATRIAPPAGGPPPR